MTLRKLAADVEAVRAAVSSPMPPQKDHPLLAAVEAARARRTAADEEIRLLLAYGRRFVYPHRRVATAAGAGLPVMGVSGVVERVLEVTGLLEILTSPNGAARHWVSPAAEAPQDAV